MTGTRKWEIDGVLVVRGGTLQAALRQSCAMGRVTALSFTGTGGRETWIGLVSLQPCANTGPHHHGRHEVAIYLVKGSSEIRWGEQLEFRTVVGAGDFVYFAPYVPHQEVNLDNANPVEFIVVRSDGERIADGLDIAPAQEPLIIE